LAKVQVDYTPIASDSQIQSEGRATPALSMITGKGKGRQVEIHSPLSDETNNDERHTQISLDALTAQKLQQDLD